MTLFDKKTFPIFCGNDRISVQVYLLQSFIGSDSLQVIIGNVFGDFVEQGRDGPVGINDQSFIPEGNEHISRCFFRDIFDPDELETIVIDHFFILIV